MQQKKLVIGNWKMNPNTQKETSKLFSKLTVGVKGLKNIDVVVALSFPHLALTKPSRALQLAAQNVDVGAGPLTGGVSIAMLHDLKVTHIIIGHSERRARGESEREVSEKVAAAIKAGMTAVICVGEKERDTHGKYLGLVETQVLTALETVSRSQLEKVVLAYEPVWAISSGDGKGVTATPEHAHEMKLFVQKVLVGKYGRTPALRVPVIYGGSVNAENALALLSGAVDGFLVGGASLKPEAFISILKTTSTYGTHS